MPLIAGQPFAGYTILRLLGAGGMGEVYLAQHPRLPRRDALKLLPRDISGDHTFRGRFEREADLASTLWHPHIVGVHDRGNFGGQLWISMDFVDGVDAAHLMADRYPDGMPLDQVVAIVTAVASALDYAHKNGLLHRDVKPANVMLTHLDDEAEQRILLTDFGIARTIDDISGLTTTNMILGTLAYTAPEQLMGDDIDGRADQYALAATTYHLLTGTVLFPHTNPAAVISRHLTAAPPTLADLKPDLAALDSVLSSALAKDPHARYSRCSDFARALANESKMHTWSSASVRTLPAAAARRSTETEAVSSKPKPRLAPAEVMIGSRRRWLLPIVLVTISAITGVVALTWKPWEQSSTTIGPPAPGFSSSSTAQPPPPSPPRQPNSPVRFAAAAIDTLLLTPTQVRRLTGGVFRGQSSADMVVTNSTYGM